MDVAPAWKDFRNCLPAKIRVLPIHLGDERMVASFLWSGAALQPREFRIHKLRDMKEVCRQSPVVLIWPHEQMAKPPPGEI